ncbi:C40 family peptidase [uncultured Bifidobacterium sp.]|uniref:C40 family peptidase n=1 Tax=uncultured Bifidobacterium sp. TaxID=165187 RepID=UPI00258B6405|nr:C40 family peptidase [uncultured Bifidobacterium sp.]
MSIVKKTVSIATAFVAAGLLSVAVVPLASADADQSEATTSTRSFPKVTTVRKDLLSESTSTEVDGGADWGGIESLDVPQTKSPAEIAAEAEAAEQARQQAAAAAASRSSYRESVTSSSSEADTSAAQTSTVSAPAGSATGSAIAQYSLQFKGYPYMYGGTSPSGWDCSGFVQYVFAQFGVSLPRTSGAMMSVGSPVGSLAEAQPGDIIASAGHAAIYIGNGMVMNAMDYGAGTNTAAVAWVFPGGGYAIRRVV